ncbi:MAG TPA: dihydrolipoamide acetyltransferase family protein [Terriglobales bacterium]|nr:dihydrolipoamide acetyltransferase family protein [Terriglobales bacterium]
MPISVVMPALEMAQETGKLISWLKKEGENVAKGEPLLEVETDKAVMEVEAPGDGILAGIKAQEGDVIPVGRTIAWLVAPGEKPPAEAAPPVLAARAGTKPSPAVTAAAAAMPAAPAGAKISPKARRLAREYNVDISRVRGTGPEGAITTDDVLAAAEPAAAAVPAEPAAAAVPAEPPLSSLARLMAERTTKSWTTAPHFYLAREVDAGALNAARGRLAPALEKDRGVRLSHTDLLVALAGRVLARHPRLNGSWTGSSVRLNPEIGVGVAVAVDDGVVAVVIPNADKAPLAEISGQLREKAERARAGRLHPADISGATFTISNLGMYGVDAFHAIITPPQAAILAVGRIADRVVAVNGQPAVRPMMTLTLSCDHRVVDGAQAAKFLHDLAEAIANPDSLDL